MILEQALLPVKPGQESQFEAAFAQAMEFMADESRFDRGLARLLDGIEAEFAPK